MNKYKIIGIVNLLFGASQFLISIIFPLFLFPNLIQTYTDLNVNSEFNLTGGYIVVLLILIIAITSLVIGVKGLTVSKEKEKYLKYGVISAVATFFLTGVLVAILNFSVTSQIYNLTSQF